MGVKQESLFVGLQQKPDKAAETEHWNVKRNGDWPVGIKVFNSASAFTVVELGEMLPERVYDQSGAYLFDCGFYTDGKKPYVKHSHYEKRICEQSTDTEADARATMLVYLLENKLISFSASQG